MSQSARPQALETDPKPQGDWQRGTEVGLIFLVFFIFGGDPAPHLNEPHYLCRFKHFWQPNWAAGDLFLQSPDAHFVVVFAFGWLTKFLSLAATAWTLRIAVWLALAWAWQRLSYRLVPQNWCAPLAAAIWTLAIEQGNLAGEWVIGGFEAKCVAYVFVLLALRELVDNRWNRAWLLLGCASAFHVLVGGWSVIASLFVWAILRRGGWGRSEARPPAAAQTRATINSPPPPFLTMLPGLSGGGTIALLGLIPTLTLNWGTPLEVVEEANYIYTFVRLPHHLALLQMDKDWLLERAGRHVVVLTMGLLLAWRLWRYGSDSAHGPLGRLILFAAGALALAACGLAIELMFWNYPYTAANLQRFYWYRLNDITATAIAAWLLVDWIAQLLDKRRLLGVVLLTVVLALVGGRMTWLAYHRGLEPIAPADRKVASYADWVDMCQWIGDNTPPASLFLVPKESHSFKWRTGRPEVVTRKDIPQDAASMVQWHRRLRDVFPPPTERLHLKSRDQIETARVSELAQKYDADFFLTSKRLPLSFPIIYSNGKYELYDLRHLQRAALPEATPEAGHD